MSLTAADLARARRHLTRRDPVFKRLCALVGPCTLRPVPGDGFSVLARAIVAQMISTKAARAISTRLAAALPGGAITPAGLAALDEPTLRGVGLSGAKARSLLDLASRAVRGELPIECFPAMDDDAVIERLVAVRGIGRWTAEMYLIFCLGRLDVLPVDDYGLRAGVQEQYGLGALPGRAALRALAEPWRPYRTVATWYFWKSRGWVPQSEDS